MKRTYSNREPVTVTPGRGGELVTLTAEDGSDERHFIVSSDISDGHLKLISDPSEEQS